MGGFGIVGITEHLSNVFAELPVRGLTVISNTPGLDNFGFGRQLDKGQVKRLCASFFGANKNLENSYIKGKIEGEFIP